MFLQPFPCDIKRLSPEGQCNNVNNISTSEDETKVLTDDKVVVSTINKRNRRKESKHYQESDILEATSVYCRSGLSEKQSDYEDLWTQNDAINSPIGRTLSSFRTTVSNKNESDANQSTNIIFKIFFFYYYFKFLFFRCKIIRNVDTNTNQCPS